MYSTEFIKYLNISPIKTVIYHFLNKNNEKR